MATKRQLIIFSDLDGTLLDFESYSPAMALDTLDLVKELGIPIVLCSSKTRREMDFIRQSLGIRDPFIVENGGAVCIPAGYFPFEIEGERVVDNQVVIELGKPYRVLLETVDRLRSLTSGKIVGFNDLTVPELARECKLSLSEAQRAKAREYDEPFKLVDGKPGEEKLLSREIARSGLKFSKGGGFWHIHGGSDKGQAVRLLSRYFKKLYKLIETVGIGDSGNDASMLREVDIPILVMKPNRTFDEVVLEEIPELNRVFAPGPSGWDIALRQLIGERYGELKGSA